MSKRAAIYARISTRDQKTPEAQSEKMKAYIKSRDWLHVKSVEEIASGAKTQPKRQQLLEMARRREIERKTGISQRSIGRILNGV